MFYDILIVYVNISGLLLKIFVEIFLVIKYKRLKKFFFIFSFFLFSKKPQL